MRITILVGFAVSVLSIVGTGFAKAETCSHRRAICLAGERSREYTPPLELQSGVALLHGNWRLALQNPPTVMAYHRPMCSAGASQGRQAEGEPGIGAKLIEGREDDAAA